MYLQHRIYSAVQYFKLCNYKIIENKNVEFYKYSDINIGYTTQPAISRKINSQLVSILQLSKLEKCSRHVCCVTATFQPQQLYNDMNEGSTPPRGRSRFYVKPAICHFQINITSNAIMQNIITAKYLLWTRPTWIQNKMKNLGTLKP